MKLNRPQLIEQLVRDLRPVRPVSPPEHAALAWWLGTWCFVVLVALAIAPLRPGAFAQAATHTRFALESLGGLGASLLIALFAIADSIPAYARRSLLWSGLGLAGAWCLAYVIGLEYPALEPSMAGKRAECVWETLFYSVPPALAGIGIARRYFVLNPVRSVALITLAAAMVPALLMQFACMYDPAHILTHHLLPIPVLVTAAAGLQWLRMRVTGN